MAHKRVDKEAIQRIEESIATTKRAIQRIKDVSAFGRDSKKLLTEWLKDCTETAAACRDSILTKLGLGQVNPEVSHAITWAAAQVNAYQNTLDILLDPQKIILFYENELKELEHQLESYKEYEQPR